MREGFVLLSAVVMLVLVSTILALALSMSTLTGRQTEDLYMREQAQILAKGATEFALLAISGHDNTADCIERIDLTYPADDPVFDINVSLRYLGRGLPCNGSAILSNAVATAESNMTVVVDTRVQYKDPTTAETVIYHRRTLQKP